ncbi:MAG TPA: DUF5985 family protein [Pseudonocardia sp.]|jgi:hypothetical protein|nr:DUF5985 family protein [Pseudonocardia sp.]
MNLFLWGALAMASATVAVFFLRFWAHGRDRLFLFFALGFAAFALHWLGLGIVAPPVESRHYLYVLRLLAFLLILAGIVDKNRSTRRATAR